MSMYQVKLIMVVKWTLFAQISCVFDRIDHSVILNELNSLRFNNSTIQLFTSCFSVREQ